MRIKIFLAAALLGALCAFTGAGAFSISPIKYHLTFAPGAENQPVVLNIKNDEAVKKFFTLKVLGAKQNDNGLLEFGSGISQAEQWVRFAQDKFSVLPGESKEAVFYISIPESARAGSYYLGLGAESVGAGGNQIIGVSGQLMAPLLLQVAGIVGENLNLEKWQTPGFTMKKTWPCDLNIKNNGAAELPVRATLTVRNWLNRESYKEEINLGGFLLPATGRAFHFDVNQQKKGIYLPGPMQAEIKVHYGRTNQVVTSIVRVWYLPAWSIVAFIIILIAAAIAFLRKNK